MTPKVDPVPGTLTITRKEWRSGQGEGAREGRREVEAEGKSTTAADAVIEEVPVALVYNGISHVVMMATPVDLEDFALGFSLSEGLLESTTELLDIDISHRDSGIEVNLTILAQAFARLKTLRRNMTGRTGCGLCGAESLEQVMPKLEKVSNPITPSHKAINRAVSLLREQQVLQRQTGAAHAAAWCDLEGNLTLIREDVGRHIALDKLLGALCRQGINTEGFAVVTSRASYEMVIKLARLDLSALVGVSAATSLAISTATDLGISLVGFAEQGRHLVYT